MVVRPLTHRQRSILFATVTEYIAHGQPVGSRTLARGYGIDLSAATIRNVLADLEDSGFLHQPHTSAGRVPTELGLRTFIDALSEVQQIPLDEQTQLRQRLEQIFAQRPASQEALRGAGQLLSELSGAAAVVAAAPNTHRKLSQLRFIPTKPNQLLAVLVFADGMVENRYIDLQGTVDSEQLVRIHNLLADVVEGRSLDAVRDLFATRLADDRGRLDELRRQAFSLAQEAVQQVPTARAGVVIQGSARLMDMPEYKDAARLKLLVLALDEREHLVDLLNRTREAGIVSVYIGSETGELEAAQLSLIVAPYGDGIRGGAVGVLGPTRIDYARLVPLVDATATAMTAALKKNRKG